MQQPKKNELLLKNGATQWLHFHSPSRILIARTIDEVLPALREIEAETAAGNHAAGYLTYEAAPAFDSAFKTHTPDQPLLWFGIYPEPAPLSESDFPTAPAPATGNWQLNATPESYRAQIAEIKEQIAAGDTYQVNHTLRLQNDAFNPAEGWPFFLNTILPLDSHYSAYLETDTHTIASGSPELFFQQNGNQLTCRPMKGTLPRGPHTAADNQQRNRLGQSAKDRAENVMITDMIRNDLGRIADPGTVHTTHLFDLEKYATVWQMTSTVTAQSDAGIADLFRALFPCASITGAPKIRTMQIIRELEDSPRGIYTGTIGYIAPNRHARFNVAIRTLAIDKKAGTAQYGTGGGIVWDSQADAEFQECQTKTLTLTAPRPRFQLLETALYEPGTGIFLLEKHLDRLQTAADYFNFACDIEKVRETLLNFKSDEFTRLRLLVSRDGKIDLQAVPLGQEKPVITKPWKLELTKGPVDSNNPFLYHKTTHRNVYDQAKAGSTADDVILFNARGEITETTIANIVIQKNGRQLTPPISSGLLSGTYRQHLIETGEVEESILTLADLKTADKIWLINSVRGRIPAYLLED
jgi:para-aminobenzoate synthetase/4-amino-4-deoxychorismate lyase